METGEYYLETDFLDYDRERAEQELNSQKERFANMLRGEMGDDIDDVLSGRVKIDIPKHRQFLFKLKCFIKRFFEKV